MATTQGNSVTIVNKNYPPNPGITGESASELAAYLENADVEVYVIHTDAGYGSESSSKKPSGRVIEVKSLYSGKNKLLRLLASFVESYRLIRMAKQKGKGLLIIMTDPPFLIFWSALLLKKRKWAYWSMDLYPEGFAAANLINSKRWLFRRFKQIVYRNPPHFIISLGKLQYEFLKEDYQKEIPGTELPCGIWQNSVMIKEVPSWKENDGKIYFGYCGNLGEAHSEKFLEEAISQLDPGRHTMILSLYGAKAKAMQLYARKFPVVKLVDSVSKDHLSYIDVHLVTLREKWNHICVPSKAVSAVCAGAAILFCGTPDNDNWYYLQKAGWLIDERKDVAAQLRNILNNIHADNVLEKKKVAAVIARQLLEIRKNSYDNIASFTREIRNSTEEIKQDLMYHSPSRHL